MPLEPSLRARFAAIVGPGDAEDDPAARWMYARDASPFPPREPDLILRPATTEQVRAIVRLATAEGVPIYPRSSRVNLWGGAIPLQGGIVLDMARMNRVLSVDPELFSCTVEPGATVHKVVETLAKRGFYNLVSPEGALASAIGGSFLCHGDGIGSALWGTQGDAVIGCKVVLPDGDLVVTGSAANPASPRETGTSGQFFRYGFANDLTGLFAGSEGTLGVLVELTLRIEKLPERYGYAAYNFARVEDACDVLYEARLARVPANFAALRDQRSMRAVNPTVEHPPAQLVYILEGDSVVVEHYLNKLGEMVGRHGGEVGDSGIAETYWRKRFSLIPGGMYKLGARLLLPLHYPLGQLGKFYRRVQSLCESVVAGKYGLPYFIGGFQIGTAFVIYPTLMYLEQYPEQYARVMACGQEMKRALLELGGAPIELGRLWGDTLSGLGSHYELLKRIKRAVDPRNIMNPGILFPVGEEVADRA